LNSVFIVFASLNEMNCREEKLKAWSPNHSFCFSKAIDLKINTACATRSHTTPVKSDNTPFQISV
jgi:hypothetical protein